MAKIVHQALALRILESWDYFTIEEDLDDSARLEAKMYIGDFKSRSRDTTRIVLKHQAHVQSMDLKNFNSASIPGSIHISVGKTIVGDQTQTVEIIVTKQGRSEAIINFRYQFYFSKSGVFLRWSDKVG